MRGKIPGQFDQGFSSWFIALTTGGSLGDQGYFSAPYLYSGTLNQRGEETILHVCVRTSDAKAAQPAALDLWCIEYDSSHSYVESEAHARRLCRTWHSETYVFDHWEKNGRLRRKKAVYRFVEAHALQPVPQTHGWRVGVGAQIALPSAANKLPVETDKWNALLGEVEAATGVFHRIAALVPADTVEDQLAGPRVAVEHCRAEAARLAAIGHELDSLPNSESLAGTAAEVEDQLVSTRNAAIEAVKLVGTIGLRLPDVFIDDARVAGDMDLTALSEAIAQLSATN